jgi:disulfide oxidoreductase YuzD
MRFGPAIEVDYVDLEEPGHAARFGDLIETIQSRNLPYPLVAINGELRLAGSAQYFQVMPLVEKAIQGQPAPDRGS